MGHNTKKYVIVTGPGVYGHLGQGLTANLFAVRMRL